MGYGQGTAKNARKKEIPIFGVQKKNKKRVEKTPEQKKEASIAETVRAHPRGTAKGS